jgi:hypothetical protein
MMLNIVLAIGLLAAAPVFSQREFLAFLSFLLLAAAFSVWALDHFDEVDDGETFDD